MKRHTIAMFIIALALFATSGRGQIQTQTIPNAITQLQIGSVTAVKEHNAVMAENLGIDIEQIRSDSLVVKFTRVDFTRTYTNADELNAFMRQKATLAAQAILTSTNAEMNGKFRIVAVTMCFRNGNIYSLMSLIHEFSLNNSNGVYSIPSFDAALFDRAGDKMPYNFPSINWAILEVFTTNAVNQYAVYPPYDSRTNLNPSVIVNKADQILLIPNAYSTGKNPLKLIVSSGTNAYQVFNKNGLQIPEVLPGLTRPLMANGSNTVHVIPGDPGRTLLLQSSVDLINWTNVNTGYNVTYDGLDPGFNYQSPTTGPRRFYRVKGQ